MNTILTPYEDRQLKRLAFGWTRAMYNWNPETTRETVKGMLGNGVGFSESYFDKMTRIFVTRYLTR